LKMVAAFVRHGVELDVIRATIDFASKEFADKYPLSNQRFKTDGRPAFSEAVEAVTAKSRRAGAERKRHRFSEIVKPSLYTGIEFNPDGSPKRWFPVRGQRTIVLDPGLRFGTPTIAEAGIPVDTIYASFFAEGLDADMTARVFDVTIPMVKAAVGFQEELDA
jgi:uncharacterized protein (DUF433 family)